MIPAENPAIPVKVSPPWACKIAPAIGVPHKPLVLAQLDPETYAIATNPPPIPIMVPISRMSLQIEAIAAFCTLIRVPWKNPKKTQNTYNPGIVIPNHVKIVTLFIRANGTRTLNLGVRESEDWVHTVQIGRQQTREEFVQMQMIHSQWKGDRTQRRATSRERSQIVARKRGV